MADSGKHKPVYFMWQFWLNYFVILPLLLPFAAVNMRYQVSIDGQDIPQEPQMRTVLDCYQYAAIEGFANPWNFGVIAAHWLVPLILMYVIWTLLARRRDSGELGDAQHSTDRDAEIVDAVDP